MKSVFIFKLVPSFVKVRCTSFIIQTVTDALKGQKKMPHQNFQLLIMTWKEQNKIVQNSMNHNQVAYNPID